MSHDIKCNPRAVLSETMLEIGEKYDQVVAFSCDSTNGGFAAFAEKYPERFIECGIAEQNAISTCGGMAKLGFTPFIAAINPFLTMRSYEQIRDDVGYANTDVKIFGIGAGVSYSTLGPSHETLEDVAVMRTVPNLRIICPCDGQSVKECAYFAAQNKGPVYVRMPIQPLEKKLDELNERFFDGRLSYIRKEGKVLIIATGAVVQEANDAVKKLEAAGVEVAFAVAMSVKPLSKEDIIKAAECYESIVTVEEHSIFGGLATAVAEILASAAAATKLVPIGIPEEGTVITGEYNEVLEYYGLSADAIAERVSKLA